MSSRFGGALAAVGLIGRRIAAGSGRGERTVAGDCPPPAWLHELDEYEGGEEISLALYSELGEVLSARIEGIGPRIGTPVVDGRGAGRGVRSCEGRTRCLKKTA